MSQEHPNHPDPTPNDTSPPQETDQNLAGPTAQERLEQLTPQRLCELEEKSTERDKFFDHLQHQQAELENYRKRTQREREELRRYGAQSVLRDQLPLLDTMDLAIRSARGETSDIDGLRQGLEQLQQQLWKVLTNHGVQEIEALGKPFDPSLHEVMLSEPTTDAPHMSIIEVLQKGFLLHDRLLRAARVKVAQQPEPSDIKGQEDEPTPPGSSAH